ncbi:MAG: hypothetical protein D3923_00305 [Candidatus Electrothrix sp. AR3]|nr:hypothetical protein [Candidatus Electrothrix sp. AR3]
MAKAKDYYGDTVTAVIVRACKDLSASQEELDIEVLETGSVGIFGLCKKKAHIRVSKKSERAGEVSEQKATTEEPVEKSKASTDKKKEPSKKKATAKENTAKAEEPEVSSQKPESKNEEQAEKTPPAATNNVSPPYKPPSAEALTAVQDDILAMLELMGFPSTVTVTLEYQTVARRIDEEYQDVLVGQDGRTLDSLQYLLRKMSSKQLPERTKLSLDVGNTGNAELPS